MPIARLEPAYLELQREARALAESVEPFAAEADESSAVDARVLDRLRASGLCGVAVPAGWGGRSESVDPLAVAVVREALMGSSSQLDSLFALQGIGSYAIARGGSDAQRDRWLPDVAGGAVLAGLALTERDAGSDLKAVATTLQPTADGLMLRGEKSFISNAGAAGFYTVLAREDAGLSLVLVEADAPGVSVTRTQEIIAPHVLGDLHFDGVMLPPSARIGAPGGGLELVLATLGVFRASVAAAAVGLAQAALEEATRHAASRSQFGRPLARHGPVAALLADSWTEIEMARLLTYRAAELARDDPQGALNWSSMAKLAATEMASRVVDRSVQAMGRWGLSRDRKIERLYRQARPMRIYEGASEVLRLGIARTLVDTLE
ncbi:MAG TPA: acyl-CoA dehydrogenase family protein [Thermoleophilaceae bacterium]|nr:acyl-CoA dehydrogenase family protein [Thermoleophilaceae bacterium]